MPRRATDSKNHRPTDLLTAAFAIGFGLGTMLRRRQRQRQFHGQLALVTGGSRGLGLQLVRELSRRGARVLFCARTADEVKKAEELLHGEGYSEVRGMVADISRPDGPTDLAARIRRQFGPVQILINNAGIIQVMPFVHSKETTFHDCIDTFVYGPLRMSQALLPDMITSRAGSIVNIASLGGQIPFPHMVAYNTGKAALVALSEGMSVELDRYGINVLTVKPALMRTGSHRNALFAGNSSQEYAWFSRAAIHPALALPTETAARQIVEAISQRRRTLSLGWEAKWAPLFHSLLPEVSHLLSSTVEKRMPGPGPQERTLMGELVAPDAPPLGSLMGRLEKKAIEAHQTTRFATVNGDAR